MNPSRALLSFAALVVLAVSGCSAVPITAASAVAAEEPAATEPAPEPAPPVRYASIGDSTSDWLSSDNVPIPENSWTTYAAQPDTQFVGGWAAGGAPTLEMVYRVTAMDTDVLVVMAGTNDMANSPVQGPGIDGVLANIDTFIGQANSTGMVGRVIISAIAPGDRFTTEFANLNAALAPYAAARGYTFVDPWVDVRDTDQTYTDGATIDGIHPTPESAQKAGHRLHDAIVRG